MRALPILAAGLALATAAACAPDGAASPVTTTGSESTTPGSDGSTPSDATASGGGGGGTRPTALRLAPFADCTTFLDHVKAEAQARVGPWGLDGSGWGFWAEDGVGRFAVDEAAEEAGAEFAMEGDDFGGALATGDSADSGDAGVDFTGTNVQELGVDEPDIVKTDGTRILAVSENRLSYIDVTGEPVLTDSIDLPEGWGHELFIRGDRALLFTNGGQWAVPFPIEVATTDAEAEFADDIAFPEGQYGGPAALIFEVDLSNPADLRIAASMRVEGQYLSARAIDDTVRLAINTAPTQLPWLYPQNQTGEERATEANRQVIAESTLEDWVPNYSLDANGTTVEGALLDCGRAHRPTEFSGFDMISIVDLSLADGLAGSAQAIDAVGVLAGGQTVYSSTDRMYVATTKWAGADDVTSESRLREWNEDYVTDLHAFAISPDAPTEYVASGSIEGSLLNQFSMDEHEGFLRVITTDGSPWGAEPESETHLVVYEEQGDQLVPIGEVGGLGRGEQLYSARLMGDVGFAVTFRQIDPFYVLDLSDPRNPRMAGELKIPGFSTYLHPVGEDRVLGVGQDATEDGAVTGFKLSLFDVADPANPREISVWSLPNAESPAQWNHRAFQMHGSTAIVPIRQWDGDFNGAILFDVADQIVETGRVTHVEPGVEPSSDCRPITTDDLTPEGSELWWMVNDGYGRVQLCEPGDVGGWGGWWCDPIPVDQLRNWYGDGGAAAEADLAAIGAEPGDVIEVCWPDDGYRESIQRSLVIGDVLWTTSTSTIQANQLDGLGTLTRLPLR